MSTRTAAGRLAAPGLADTSAGWLSRAAGWLAALLIATTLPVHAQGGRTLQAMDFVALDGDRVQLMLTLSAPSPEPAVFTIDKPARLSLDLPDTTLALAERYRKINVGLVRSIAAAEAKGRTRVVIEMAALTAHKVRVDGNKVLLELAGSSGSLAGTGLAPAAAPAASAPASVASAATPAQARSPTSTSAVASAARAAC